MRKLLFGIIAGLVLGLVIGGYSLLFRKPDCTQQSLGRPLEVEITPIALAEPLNRRTAEISGMDWYGDYLVILPQYFDHAEGRVLYAIPKAVILERLQNPDSPPIEPIQIPVEDRLFGKEVDGDFEGYEAIAFIGDQVYLTVEISGDDEMIGILISGKIDPDMSRVVLDIENRQPIPPQQQIRNITDEALLAVDGQVITIFEANGAVINPFPTANVFGPDQILAGQVPFPTIEYRVTDATRLDADNNFWVINTYTLGTPGLDPQMDSIGERFGLGCTQAFYPWVERLVELHYDPLEGITLTDSPPIQFKLRGYLFSRNWEGIVRLDDLGFLVATDKFPSTIFGFVPFP
ncbi:MAG: hypothetical protein GWN30_17305 [Gammaproteobacteria bacterium]|nr:hypothetical protein [Gammaproteobacteria bacterium]